MDKIIIEGTMTEELTTEDYDVAIWKIDNDSWFSDNPDVLEVSEV